MKILILANDYPSEDNLYASPFIHSRCLEYVKYGHDVCVVSFISKKSYEFEGIKVVTIDSLKINYIPDIVMAHAPERATHLRIIKKRFADRPLIMFFHGHEIMNINKHYPKSYTSEKKYDAKRMIRDIVKLFVLKHFIYKKILQKKIHIIFVSEWMKSVAMKDLKLNRKEKMLMEQYSSIIYNSANSVFLKGSSKDKSNKDADFITIRPFDNPKYAIDLVYKIAKENPNFTFHIYGEGEYFETQDMLSNLKVIKRFLPQKEIPALLNHYKYALMPTRLDAQGVMMCEIASYGMPLVTSDIPVCHEMLDGYNVAYIPNDMEKTINIEHYVAKLDSFVCQVDKQKFNAEYLISKELKIVENIKDHARKEFWEK